MGPSYILCTLKIIVITKQTLNFIVINKNLPYLVTILFFVTFFSRTPIEIVFIIQSRGCNTNESKKSFVEYLFMFGVNLSTL